MWTLYGVWPIILVSVSAIRVPTHWNNEQRETIKMLVPDYNGYELSHPGNVFQRRMFDNVPGNLPQDTIIYNPLQSTPQIMQPLMVINPNNGLYVPGYQELYKNLQVLNPRYTEEDLNHKKLSEKTQKLLRGQRPNLIANENPNNVFRIKPRPMGYMEKQAMLNKIAMDYNSGVYDTDSFQVSASTLSPLKYQFEPATKKEPVITVTEGYRNVLVQGANRKKYQMENPDETKQILTKEKPQKKRKVTKIYKIHHGGPSRNLVHEQPKRIPQVYINENRRKHLRQNYRDDDLHEPEDDTDVEKDDEEDEKLDKDEDEQKSEETDEDENEVTNEENEEVAVDAEFGNKEVPHSEHADPKPVPTKPIYPGEGQWAKPGVKHRVYNPQHKFLKPQEDQENPSGYNVFEDLESFFETQKDSFGQTFGANSNLDVTTPTPGIIEPNPPNPIVVYDPFTESSNLDASFAAENDSKRSIANSRSPKSEEANDEAEEDAIANNTNLESLRDTEKDLTAKAANNNPDEEVIEESDEDTDEEVEENDEDEDEFVPLQLYSQVRKSENEEHEPYNPLEHGRLREVIKDSKVQTVYTEEGYEDSAYDHAGHEKKAEKDQGYSEFDREKVGKDDDKKDLKEEVSKKVVVFDKPLDSIASDSIYPTSNNFISTQEVKTTQIKDKTNGNMQLEIENEVKVISQPNNSTKTHRYIKIFPKISREIAKDASTTTTTEKSETIHQKINNMAESTTESSTVSNIESMTKKTDNLNRRKRSSGTGFEDVNIDTDFIDKINHTFAPKPEIDINKYPYYTMPNLNENSPLRYAENMDNIPDKTEGELSFYKMADNKYECADIPENIDPIPEHVKNPPSKKEENSVGDEEYDSDEEEEEAEDARKKRDVAPRIQLGDKIDCLRARYFGENPLDSPFFKEETVGPVKPIFKELGPNPNKIIINKNERKFETSAKDNLLTIENDKAESIRSDIKVPLVLKPTPSPSINLITTPQYTLKLTPKNIYDQIKLLDHLALGEQEIIKVEATNKDSTNEEGRKAKALEQQEEDEPNDVDTTANKKVDKEETSTLEPEALRRKLRPRRPNYQIFDVTKYLTTTPFSLFDTASTTVLPKYKVFSEVFYKDEIKPNEQLNVFADVQNNIKNSIKVDLPLASSSSDFAEPNAVTVSTLETTVDLPRATKAPGVRVKKFQVDSTNHNKDNVPENNNPKSYNVLKHHVKTPGNQLVNLAKIMNDQNSHKRITSNPIIVSPILKTPPTTKHRKIRRRRKPSTTTTSTTLRTTTNIRVPEESVPNNHQPFVIDFIEDTQEVIGLVPPQDFEYRTIPEETFDSEDEYTEDPKPVNSISEPPAIKEDAKLPLINNYYFPGLKPPAIRRARPYSEFTNINKNLVRRRIGKEELSRNKREAARPAYADLSRNRGRQNEGLENSSKDDVDDYVPHRPKNYHYDEETGKIVYHTKPKVEEKEEELEYEEIEIPDTPGVYLERAEDATHPTPEKVTTKELLATATPPPDGKGLLDFVVKLKNNPNYKFIPDPTTLKPAFVTVDPKSTDPPEFLSILSKVKSDKNYKSIEDPKESKSKPRSTTAKPEIEEEYEDEEDEEDVPEHVQNSPGGQAQDLANIQIFDIGDYLPKVKSFTPKTTIDYSKYKTIERKHSKPQETDEPEEDRRPSFNPGGQPLTERNIEEKESIERPIYHHKKEPASTTTTSTTTTTTEKIVQFRRGTRPTTQKTTNVDLTEQPTTRRSRRPVPSGFRTTRKPTTSAEDAPQTTEKVARVYPENYSTERSYSDQHDKAKRVYRRRPVRIRHTTERDSEDAETVDKIVRRSLDIDENEQPEFEEVYQEIKEEIVDGNDDDDTSESKQSVEIIDKEYVEMQRHGGNYKEQAKENVKENDEVEILNPKYDKTRKHGGNYRKETKDDSDGVEIINKDYDRNPKHGGNYRKSSEEENEEDNIDDSNKEREEKSDQNVQPNNDATIKRISNIQQTTPKAFEPKITRKIRIRIRPTTTTTESSRSIPRLTDVVPKPDHFYSDPQLPRQINNLGSEKPDLASEELTEVTENGDAAEEKINSERRLGSEASDEIDANVMGELKSSEVVDETDNDSVEVVEAPERPNTTRRRRIKLRRRKFNQENSTKKPLYIKDPSKRLYYYASV